MRTEWYFAAILTVVAASGSAWANTITVNPTGSLAFTEGGVPLNLLLLATFADSSTANDPLSGYGATINWGDGISSQASIFYSNGQFSVESTHTFAEEGQYTISGGITSPGGGTASFTESASVADAPLTGFSVPLPQLVEGGQAFSGSVGSFQDFNGAATVSDFTAIIHWGDGTPPSLGTITQDAGRFYVTGNHQYIDEGNYAVTVSVLDQGGSTAQISDEAVIIDAPLAGQFLPFSAAADSLFTGAVGTFEDGDPYATPSDFSTTIRWGDGTASTGTVILLDGLFSVSGSHTYAAPGSYLVLAEVDDKGGSTVGMVGLADIAAPEPGAGLLVLAGLAALAFFRRPRAV
jgi:PKD repeat protein